MLTRTFMSIIWQWIDWCFVQYSGIVGTIKKTVLAINYLIKFKLKLIADVATRAAYRWNFFYQDICFHIAILYRGIILY